MGTRKLRSIFVTGALFVFFLCCGFGLLESSNTAYAESGRCDVYNGTTLVSEAVSVRDGWELCKENYDYTLVLTSDVRLDKELQSKGLSWEGKINFDMNGYSIDCHDKTRAFLLHKKTILNIYNSQYGKKESVIKNSNGSAIKSYGVLTLDGIKFEKCSSSHGGALCIIAANFFIIKFNDPHADVRNCTFYKCDAEHGGAIYTSLETLGVEGEIPDQYEDLDNYVSSPGNKLGASLRLSNCKISYCEAKRGNYGDGGAISFQGKCLIQDSVIEHNYAEAGGGGIVVGADAELLMENTKVNYNKSHDGPAGGIYIPDSVGGEVHKEPGKATIIGGEIIGNEGDIAGGILLKKVHGGAELTIGGELIVKDNIDTSKKQRNIELTNHVFELTSEGLTGKAEVGIGTTEKGKEVIIGVGCDAKTAYESSLHMFPDHNAEQEAGNDDEIGIFNYIGNKEILMGPSKKVELISFKLTGQDRANVKVEIDNEKNTVTAKFPFKEGVWFENWEAEWYAGKRGASNEGEVFTSVGHVGSREHPFTSGTSTYSNAEKVDNDYISIKRNGLLRHWTIVFINDPGAMGKVIVENGIVKDKIAEPSSTDKKKIYALSGGECVKLKADDPAAGQAFDYWELGKETTTGTFGDYNNPNADCWVPNNDGVLHLIAHYTEKKKVTVINGTLENGSTEGYFSPGEEVKIKADNTKTFSKWTVVSGYTEMGSGATTRAETSFKMGTNFGQTKRNYTDVVIKASELSIEEPTATLKPGKYTGNQKTYLSCKTENAKIFYSVDSSSYAEYKGGAIELTVGEYQQSRRYRIKAYSVLYDSEGKELIRSETAAFTYEIHNTQDIKSRTLIVYGGGIIQKGLMSKVVVNPGETVSAIAFDVDDDFPNFLYWEVLSGPLVLTDAQKLLPIVNFTMPNADVVLLAHFLIDPYEEHTASAIGGTVNGKSQVKACGGDTVIAAAEATKKIKGVETEFVRWDVYTKKSPNTTIASSTDPVFMFTMPDEDVVAVATYWVKTEFNVSVVRGYLDNDTEKTSDNYTVGDTVLVSSIQPKENGKTFTFDKWVVLKGSLTLTEEQSKQAENMEFEMPSEDIILAAQFKESKTPESVQVINGTVKGKSSYEKIMPGTTVNLVADSDIEGERKFSHWEAKGLSFYSASGREWSFVMPDNSVVATAVFADNNLVTINGGNRKAYSEDPFVGRNLYVENTNADIKANVPKGAEFYRWEVVSAPSDFQMSEKQKTSEKATITMKPKGDVVLKALFKHRYSATNAEIKLDSGEFKSSGTAAKGAKLTVKYTEQEGYIFDHWEAVGVELPKAAKEGEKEFTVTMPDNDVSFMAVVKDPKKIHSLKVNQGYIGDDKTKSIGSFDEDSRIKVSGKNPGDSANSSYVFAGWEAEGITLTDEQKKTEKDLEITMPKGDVTLTAKYSLRVKGTAVHGRIDGKATQSALEPGKQATATADAGIGMRFDHWEAEGLALSADQKTTEKNMSFEVPSNDFVLIAKYTESPVTVNTLITRNGVNKKSGATDAAEETGYYASEDEVIITAVNPGSTEAEKSLYRFVKWEIVEAPSGFSIAAPASEETSVTMPDGNVMLKAVFEKKHSYSATNATISLDSEAEYKASGVAYAGSTLHVKLTEEGAQLDHWEAVGVDVSSVGKATEFTLEMPDNDVSIIAILESPTTVHTVQVVHGYIDDDTSRSIGAYGAGTKLKLSGKNPGDSVNLSYVFTGWKADGITLTDEQKKTETGLEITMPDNDVILTATYSLRVSGIARHGTINGKAEQKELVPGAKATATAAVASGMVFKEWTAIGLTLSDAQKKTAKNMEFEVPSNDFALFANYTKSPITVNTLITQNGVNKKSGATDAAEEMGYYAPEDEVVITAVNPGKTEAEKSLYRFVKWEIVAAPSSFSIAAPKVAETTVTMPDEDVVLKAVFEKKYSYSATNATISLDSEAEYKASGAAFAGSTLHVKFTEEGAELDHWEAVGVRLPKAARDGELEFTVTMPDNDVSIMAVLKDPTTVHTLKVNQGYIDDDEEQSIGSYGEGTTLKATGINPGGDSNSYYTFKKWVVVKGPENLLLGQATKEAVEFDMPDEDVELKAEYDLHVIGNVIHGSLNKDNPLTPGDTVKAKASSASAMTFKEWEAIGVELSYEQRKSETLSFEVPSNDFVLIAKYTSTPVTVNTLITQNGVNRKTDADPGTAEETGTYASEDEVRIKAVNPGKTIAERELYRFVKWEILSAPKGYSIDSPTSAETDITMPDGDVVLKAVFEKKHNYTATNASISIDGGASSTSGKAFAGTRLKVAIDDGAQLDHWEAVGVALPKDARAGDAEFTVEMPDNDVSIIAVMKSPTTVHTLKLNQGYIDEDETRSIGAYGEGTGLKATGINPGGEGNSYYSFKQWEVVEGPENLLDGQASNETVEFDMPDENVELRAEYDLTVNGDVLHGSLNKKNPLTPGSKVRATAEAASGMTFKEWDAIGVSLNNHQKRTETNMEFEVPSNDFLLIARYESTPVTVNTLYTENGVNKLTGSAAEATPSGTYAGYDKVTIRAVNPGAATGEEDFYQFVAWEVVDGPDGYMLADPEKEVQEITMPNTDLVLNALYLEKHYVVGIHGTVNGQEIGSAVEGDTLEAKAQMGVGMSFDHWEASGIVLTNEQRFSEEFTANMPDNDVVLQAQYKSDPENVYTLSVTHGVIEDEYDESGKALREKDYHVGSTVVVKADEGAGLTFDHWEAENYHLSDEEMIWPELTITMPETNVQLTAKYRHEYPDPHKVTVINGSITGPGENPTGYYYEGSYVNIAADKKAGYSFIGWKTNGISLTGEQAKSESIEINMPDNDITLEACYKKVGGSDTGDHNRLLMYLGIFDIALILLAIWRIVQLKLKRK